MSTINNLTSNGYYSLKNQSSNDLLSQTGDATPLALANALGTAKTSPATTDHSYSLDLSPEALAYIQQLNNAGTAAAPASSKTSLDQFVLNRDQQKMLESIIAKYKDEPFTQATFDQIQDDLKASGLSPETLAAQDKIRSYNPTQFFLDSLNGTATASGNTGFDALFGSDQHSQTASGTDATTKSNNFMTRVADMWARSSTTVNAASDVEA